MFRPHPFAAIIRVKPLGLHVLLAVTLGSCLLPGIASAQGALTNGLNHNGAIATAGEIDTWTFIANAGDNLTLTIGEVEPTANFYPWIRLLAPNGAAVEDSSGPLAAQINVIAPQTGTYSVLVSAVSQVPTGTGGYVLRLAMAPEPFSHGDEGGELVNGANHSGEIPLADIDAWTFTAAAGDHLSFAIGEVQPSVNLNLWIRLIGPSGTQVGASNGPQAAQIANLTATQAGTYTVLVSAHANIPNGTGGYVLTMARVPGGVAVSPGDQGGYLAVATSHPGEITLGDMDIWTFLAAQGDPLAISIGEVEPTVNLHLWIRLIGPTGTQVAASNGPLAAQINVTAPSTGLYTVVVAPLSSVPTGTGHYALTLAGAIPNPLGDLVVDFGPGAGLWMRNNHGPRAHASPSWQPLHTQSPSVMAKGRLDGNAADDLVVTFPGYGVWMWMNNTSWVPLHGLDATVIVAVDLDGNLIDEIVLNFPGQGVWVHRDNGSWAPLHAQNASRIAAGRIDVGTPRDLVFDFPGQGIWCLMNSSTWVPLHGRNASRLQIANLDGNAQDDVILDFPGNGLWVRFNNSSWFALHGQQSAGLTAANIDGDASNRQDLIVNFPGFGVWAYINNSAWVQLHGFDAPILAATDLDFNGQDEVILGFPGYGVWILMNNASFEQLHAFQPEGFVAGRFDHR